MWGCLCDKCDKSVGIDIAFRMASFSLNGRNNTLGMIEDFVDSERLQKLKNGKYFIKGFIAFQFGQLNESSNLHKNVIALLQKHGIDSEKFKGSYTLHEGFMKGPSKGKGKGKGKEEEEGIVKGGKEKPTLEENSEIEKGFDEFWKSYERKGTKKQAWNQWLKLSESERDDALRSLASYFVENPERKFRKDADRFLRDRVFEDVLEREKENGTDDFLSKDPASPYYGIRQSDMRMLTQEMIDEKEKRVSHAG